jgi:hypothetical protein
MEELIINFLKIIYKGLKRFKSIFFRSMKFNISLIVLLVLLPSIYYFHLFNPGKVYSMIPRLFIIISLCLIFISIIIILSELEENTSLSDYFNNISNIIGIIKIFGIYFLAFVVFFLSFHFLKYISYNSTSSSLVVTTILLVAMLGIVHEKVIKEQNGSSNNNGLFMDILFYIPCLFTGLLDNLRNEITNIPSNTYLLSYLIIAMLFVIYILPFLLDTIKGEQSLKLIKAPTVLENRIVDLNNEELKQKIIDSRPYYQKYLLQKNKELSEKMKKFNIDKDDGNTLSIYSKRRIYLDSPIEHTYAMDIPYCINKDIICGNSGNLQCVDKKDKSISRDIIDFHGMKQKCSSDVNIFDSIYGNEFSKTFFYTDSDKQNITTIKELCDVSNSDPTCISPIDVSQSVVNYDGLPDVDTKAFMCKNNDGSYNMIYGYVDNCDNMVNFKCNNPIVTSEGFTNSLHSLDMLLENDDYLKGLTEDEKKILNKSIESSNSNTSNILKKIKSPEEIKEYLAHYLSNNENYFSLLQTIKEYNSKKNEFISQETSKLIQYINRTNQIYDYNYHYGISFWIYFDPILLTNNPESKKGFILSYSENPTIYYDYDKNTINVTIQDCENEYKKCTTIEVFKTSDILYQKWNHFVINYNYGTLDIFVNNNLVFTKNNIAPYIEKNNNNLIIGKKAEPLYNSAICNLTYHEKPLNLFDIKNLYSKRENPCN